MARRKRRRKSGCRHLLMTGMSLILMVLLAVLVRVSGNEIFSKVKATADSVVQKQFVGKIAYEEVEISENEVEEKFYYGKLGEEEQTIYKELLQGINDHETEIYLHASDAKRANEIFQQLLKDCPEIFWCDGRAKTTAYGGDEPYTVLKPSYSYSEEERERRQKEIDKEVSGCLSGISENASDFEKILYVFDYVVDTVEYDAQAEDNQNIYSVFVGKRSVCAGYSKATQYLLEKLGVFCTYVTGKTISGENHAWNLVLCEGDYYYVDTTWGDPVFQDDAEAVAKDYTSYDYLCCNDEELFKTHVPDTDTELPKCEKMDCNYYVVKDMYYEECDTETILDSMNDTISKKGNPSVFKFANDEVYAEAKEEIFGELIKRAAQNLAQWYDLKQVKYTYIDDSELNKIVIYWEYE